jgi:phage shock protein C
MDDSFSPESTTGTQGQPRNLRRSSTDSVIGGVAGGLGHYFALDPVLVRIAFVLLVLAGGSGILLYIVLWIVIPEATPEEDVVARPGKGFEASGLLLGGAMVAIGTFILLRRIIPWFDGQVMWAVLLISLGAFIVLRGVRR